MFNFPDVLLLHATEHQQNLRAEAARYRLLAGARWARKRQRASATGRDRAAGGEPAGRLAAWAAYAAQAR